MVTFTHAYLPLTRVVLLKFHLWTLKNNSASLIFEHFYTINGKAQLTQKSYDHSFQYASSSWGTQDTISLRSHQI